jgi:hypothetical protein
MLAEVQAKRLSANTTRKLVADLLGEGDGALKPVHLPNFPGGAKKASTHLGENEAFRSTMVRLADWLHSASGELRHQSAFRYPLPNRRIRASSRRNPFLRRLEGEASRSSVVQVDL